MRRTHTYLLPMVIALVSVMGCGGNTSEEASAADTAPAVAARSGTADAAGVTRVDMNAIFPQGDGRDLVLNNCQNCHTFVPIVVLQMDAAGWTRSSVDHRARVSSLSDAEFERIYTYLKANFNPQRPVPRLPPELLESWTSY